MNLLQRILLKAFFPKVKETKVGTDNEELRVQWLENTIKQIPEGHTILDAGAGEQQFKRFCDHLNYVSQDIAEYDGSGEEGLHTGTWDFGKLDIVCDIVDIPRPDHSFDAIMCTEVLEHVPDPAKVFPEFSRLLKPSGKLVITAPFCSLTHFAPYHYSTGFSKYYYEQHLESNNFKILELVPSGSYFAYVAQELMRLEKIAGLYSNEQISLLEWRSRNYLLQALERMSDNDSGSSELLCYGYHIYAEKLS